MKHALVSILVGLLAAPVSPSEELGSRWEDLPKHLDGRSVIVLTAKNERLDGRFAGIDGDQLKVEAKKGPIAVAKADIKRLSRVEKPSKRARAIITPLAAFGGMVLGLAIAFFTLGDDSGNAGEAAAIIAGTGAGAGVLGYYIGREVDRRSTEIRITP